MVTVVSVELKVNRVNRKAFPCAHTHVVFSTHAHTNTHARTLTHTHTHTRTHTRTHTDAMFRGKHSKKHDHPQP